MKNAILIRGARVHNLKNVTVEIPRNHLVVITGVSGSGKSSLAFDTLYAEGQRRYVESLSAYARQFLERLDKPDVDEIKGISPAIAIEQKNTVRTSRSTVGTATEIQDYLRLLFARVGHTVCPNCHTEVKKYTTEDIFQFLIAHHPDAKALLSFPPVIDEHNSWSMVLRNLKQAGFHRGVVNGQIVELEKIDKLDPQNPACSILVDRLRVTPTQRPRWMESLDLTFQFGQGNIIITIIGMAKQRSSINKIDTQASSAATSGDECVVYTFSRQLMCPKCGITFLEPHPRLFSFNNPFGACPRCRGFGDVIEIDLDLVIPDKSKSLRQGAIEPWNTPSNCYYYEWLEEVAATYNMPMDVPFYALSQEHQNLVINGDGSFPGVRGFFEHLEEKIYKVGVRVFLSRFRGYVSCPECHGTRLRPEALYVQVGGLNIGQINRMTVKEAFDFFNNLSITSYEEAVVHQVLTEIRFRLRYLLDVGLGYLTLDRRSATLSGGEAQRINLATALGAKLAGSLYILDEPTVGLHPRDTHRLLHVLQMLRDIGNTVIVVEHDREMIENADYILDLGPAAGVHGGEIVFQGNFQQLLRSCHSITGSYFRGEKEIPIPSQRRKGNGHFLHLRGVREHNLKNINVKIPLGLFCAITGVSGSGKSTLVHDVLYAAIKRKKNQWKRRVGEHDILIGDEYIDDAILVDQSPIGRTPRSNPATYLKAFDGIRKVFAETRVAKMRGYKPGTFSFNVKGGRCEMCEGAGVVQVEMQFLADVALICEACNGKRFKKSVLEVKYKGKNIDEVLNMTIAEALTFFKDVPSVVRPLRLLDEVGLGYMKLGQSATTLSGGEAQRVKLAAHLAERRGKHILYIFDEPTTGLHLDDISKLLQSFERLLRAGNSILVIEHNLDLLKCADYIIDLGPEGGEEGGWVVATGTPEEVAQNPNSHTGRFLREYLHHGIDSKVSVFPAKNYG